MTHTCPVHGNPITAGVYDDTTCALPECWERFGLKPPGGPAAARKALPVCPHLDPVEIRLAGSTRTWRRCRAGHGSTAKGAEGMVCGCGTPGFGVWRRGQECGPACPGYPAQAGGRPDRPE